jgi:hypothetical protein
MPAALLLKSAVSAIFMLALAIPAMTQITQTVEAGSSVIPQTMKYSGMASERAPGAVEAVFRVYSAADGGEALWAETQRVTVGQDGAFSVLLGSASEGGLPQSLFAGGQARWLGISIEGAPEQPRVPLTSVAYAMKAADAETLGGVPAADFVTQTQLRAHPLAPPAPATAPGKTSNAAHPETTLTGSGTGNAIAMWTGSGTLGNSTLTQSGSNIAAPGEMRVQSAGTFGANGTTNTGVIATGTNTGVSGTGTVSGVYGLTNSSTQGDAGVRGSASAATGLLYGVQGGAVSTTANAAGVYGSEVATKGQVYGVEGQSFSATQGASGVEGWEAAATGAVFGVSGGTNSNTANAAGVSGNEGAATGQVYGVAGGAGSTTAYSAGVVGNETAATGQVFGVHGSTPSTTSYAAGVAGNENAATGLVYGVSGNTGSTTSNAAGVSGYESATTGDVFGVSGSTSSSTYNAAGVEGYEGATTGEVWGVSGVTFSAGTSAAGVNGYEGAATAEVAGVRGSTGSTGTGASGVFGYELAATGQVAGVLGVTTSSAGSGVAGKATATSGGTSGVYGETYSSTGAGVTGVAAAAGGTAGAFLSPTGSGSILAGFKGSDNTRVFNVDASGNGTFAGNLNVTGKLTKGSGSFKIDHPLDPANKYLSHSFVESPDMMDVYNGNIVTGKNGLATVVLPDYFDALNRDFRYQLTVIGKFAQAIVAKKVANNRFVIRTSKPGVEVSWQITGIRQDAYANANRIPVEEVKPPAEQGYYLHPEAFGQPATKSVAAANKPAPAAGAAGVNSR